MPDQVIFTGGGEAHDRRILREAEVGRLQRLYAGVYTDNLGEPLPVVTRRHWLAIAGHLVPGGVLSGRSALAARSIVGDGGQAYLFVAVAGAKKRRGFALPGLDIRTQPGPGALEGDYPLGKGVMMPSKARALLDNLRPSRARTGPSWTVGAAGVEAELERLVSREGEAYLNRMRDEARMLAPLLALRDEFEQLDRIIGALLGTRKADLVTARGQARAAGEPIDDACLGRLRLLRAKLEEVALPELPDRSRGPEAGVAAAFVEAYFSNYIEGTRFDVKEAERIVFKGVVPEQRPADGHDVLATYRQLVELGDRRPSELNPDQFLAEVRDRHRELMAARPEGGPGEWKRARNTAGGTQFVNPDAVVGTLRQGFKLTQTVRHPFGRALMLHFLLTDVHPFSDGNGRVSRIMLTKELVASGLSRIVIPTVYRENYLGALRALSRHGDAGPIIRALEFVQRVTVACTARSADQAIEAWASAYAFVDPGEHARLEMPDPARRVEWRDGVPAPADYWAAVDRPGGGFRF